MFYIPAYNAEESIVTVFEDRPLIYNTVILFATMRNTLWLPTYSTILVLLFFHMHKHTKYILSFW